MTHRSLWILIILPVVAACTTARSPQSAPASSGAATAATTSETDSVARERERYVADVRKAIAGKEQQPASQVFKNVKMLTNVPAARLLAIMNTGYGKSLGVSCTHCHIAGEWDREDKPQKQIARDMSAMAGTINNQLLKNIANLKGPSPVVNCTTCHRGQVKPALNLP